jgi:hypothetical protein
VLLLFVDAAMAVVSSTVVSDSEYIVVDAAVAIENSAGVSESAAH